MKTILLGNNLDLLKTLEDNSVDSIVTDPPYGLSFMNKKWDYDVPSVELWKECYRVLKHGGHILSFGGTRTYHRMVVNIEDAGFEIRDQIMWLYGSGFPKSLNIGKAIDKMQGNERNDLGASPNERLNIPKNDVYKAGIRGKDFRITKGVSDWEGWGTGLKPANEPICVARKPLSEKSVAENVLKWGTGGINIDGCIIESKEELGRDNKTQPFINNVSKGGIWNKGSENVKPLDRRGIADGRFPANVILDEEAGQILDEQSGISKSGDIKPYNQKNTNSYSGSMPIFRNVNHKGDKGGASRFFYCAKASKKDRDEGLEVFDKKRSGSMNATLNSNMLTGSGNERQTIRANFHPTVKPTDLMRYLCRLVTPKNGIVLDPYMGSGSTGKGAILEGFSFIGMELDEEYFNIANARIENAEKTYKNSQIQLKAL